MNYNLRSTTTTPSSWKGKHRLLRLALEVQLEKVRSLQFGGHHPELEYSVEEQISEILLLLSQYSEKAIHMAMIKTIGRRGDPEYTGRCPLHLACDTNAPFQVIHILLQMEPTRTAILHRDKWEDLPLHTACSRKDYTEVVELLLQYDNSKRSVITKRYDGSLPIHTACRYNAPPKVIQLLLEADVTRGTLLMDSLYGQIPLHVACRCNLRTDSLQLLLDYDASDKNSVLMQDDAGRLPLHVAFQFCPIRRPNIGTSSSSSSNIMMTTTTAHKSSMELIFFAMLQGRLERIGLQNWRKVLLEKMIQPLEDGMKAEGNADTAFLLEETCKALNGFLEVTFLLELAVWKSRCKIELDEMLRLEKQRPPSSLRTSDDVISDTPSLSSLSRLQKRNCRITSGADVIVPGVISFLEDEPITALLLVATGG